MLRVPESQIPKRAARLPGDDDDDDAFEVWACNWPALQLFRAMKTQWQVVAVPQGLMPGRLRYLGLNYAVLPVLERRLKVRCDADTLSALQVMEVEGAAILNED